MFEESFKAVIRTLKLRTQEDDNKVLRRLLEPEIALELSKGLAKAFGKDGVEQQKLVAGGGIKTAEIKVDAFPIFTATFYASGDGTSDQHTIKDARAVTAKIKRPSKKNEEEPILNFKFFFSWREETLIYFARHLGEEITCRIKRQQTTLVEVLDKSKGKKKASKKKAPAKQTELTN